MVKTRFGLNLSWAVKRWPLPEDWAEIAARLDVKYVQFSFDLLDPRALSIAVDHMMGLLIDAVKRFGITIHSTFTGLAAYSFNMLSHPDPLMRYDAMDWYMRAIDFTAKIGVRATGGHIAAKSVKDFNNPQRRDYLDTMLIESVRALRRYAQNRGLEMILWEPMPVAREPPWTMDETKSILSKVNVGGGAQVKLNIDVGHQCTLKGVDADPYEWLKEFAPDSPSVHIQQTDGKGDRHWPFTEEYNKIGIINVEKLLEAIDDSGAKEVYIMLEYIPPFEAPDEEVLRNLEESVRYLKQYI
ncbi:MAG: TIM barrel protein [Ignisphaera sp.]|nr:sugar phosphate isomerase/epimerase [Ignisphaera sp.]MDW8084861.1 TIM barrel protein [Ignisphaera sp.]